MEPLLLITNAEAGGNGDADLERALAVLRERGDVEVCHTGDQGSSGSTGRTLHAPPDALIT